MRVLVIELRCADVTDDESLPQIGFDLRFEVSRLPRVPWDGPTVRRIIEAAAVELRREFGPLRRGE